MLEQEEPEQQLQLPQGPIVTVVCLVFVFERSWMILAVLVKFSLTSIDDREEAES